MHTNRGEEKKLLVYSSLFSIARFKIRAFCFQADSVRSGSFGSIVFDPKLPDRNLTNLIKTIERLDNFEGRKKFFCVYFFNPFFLLGLYHKRCFFPPGKNPPNNPGTNSRCVLLRIDYIPQKQFVIQRVILPMTRSFM